MTGSSRPLLLLCAAALLHVVLPLPAAPARKASQAPQPPLPEVEHSSGKGDPFQLIPKLGPDGNPVAPVQGEGDSMIPVDPNEAYDPATDPIRDSPVESVPDMRNLEQLQAIDAPGAPSDGEPMPAMPHVPGLVMPVFRPNAPQPGAPLSPTLPGGAPAAPAGDVSPGLLPAPELELAAKARWVRSPYEAYRTAGQEGKPVLIFFAQLLNGAGPSATLNDDLFALPEFNEFASARLVLTKLQYPTGSPGKNYTEEKLAVLNMVKEKFKVHGFPTLIMLDDKGKEIERISGYARVKDQSGVIYSSAANILDRLKEAEKRFSERRRYRVDRVNRLVGQGYRTWYSNAGTSLLAKMVRADADQIVLMDENGAWRGVRPTDLKLYDAEWARRKQAGLIQDPESPAETAAVVDGPPKP